MISLEFFRLNQGEEKTKTKNEKKKLKKQRDKRNRTSKTNGYSGQDYEYFSKIF